GDERWNRRRRANAGSCLRRGLQGRRRHERHQDRRRALHRVARDRGRVTLRARGSESPARPRRHRHSATYRAPKRSGRTVFGEADVGRTSKVRLLLATTNRNKVREIRALLADAPVDLIALGDVPAIVEPEETGET